MGRALTGFRKTFGRPRLGRMQGGGGSPSITSPGSIDEQPLVGVQIALTEPNVTGADSVAYLWYNGDPDASGVVISGLTSAVPTPTDAIYGNDLWRLATYTNAVDSTVEKLHAPAIVGVIFTEDFSGFTIGNVIADIIAAGWIKWSDTTILNMAGTIISAGGGPSGKAIAYLSSSYFGGLCRADWDTFFAAKGWSTKYQYLIMFKDDAVASRNAFRSRTTGTATNNNFGAGYNIRLGVPALCLPLESVNTSPVAGVLPALTTDAVYFVRGESNGVTAKVRTWLVSDPEPETWDLTRDYGSTIAGRGPSLISKGTDDMTVLYMSCAGNTDAPFWPGFDPPVPPPTDPMEYSAPVAASSFSQNGGLIVWNWEDAV